MPAVPSSAGQPSGWPWVIPPVLIIAGGFGTAALYYWAGEAYLPSRGLAGIAFAAPYLAAGSLALVGVRIGQPGLIAGGAMATFLISLVTWVLWPLVIPAGALIVHAVFRGSKPNPLGTASTALIFFGLVGAITALVRHDDPRAGVLADGSEWSASDVITAPEAVISLGITLATVAAALFLARMERARQRREG